MRQQLSLARIRKMRTWDEMHGTVCRLCECYKDGKCTGKPDRPMPSYYTVDTWGCDNMH